MGKISSFAVLRMCIILSFFQIHGSAASGIYGLRWSKIVLPEPSKTPSQYASKSHKNPNSIVPESSFVNHHRHRHHRDREHRQNAGLPYDKPAVAPSSYANHVPIQPPDISPSSYTVVLTPPPSSSHSLPPPPPNQDCTSVTCPEPWTSTVPGSPCGCVLPIQVRLQLNVNLYTFFPLISELASEIASSLSLNQSQVRIMGANAADQQPEKTVVLINLVPLSENFRDGTPFVVYQKFWRKQVRVNHSLFGAYDVLAVHYPGLPSSPPSLSSNLAAIENHPYPANHNTNEGNSLKPLGVDIPLRKQKSPLNKRILTVIIISSLTAFLALAAIIAIFIANSRHSSHHHESAIHTEPSDNPKSLAIGSRSLSETMSFSSRTLNITSYAKIYSLNEIEKATDGFNSTRVLGEGGFGVVYRGMFDDGDEVAVKVLKRDNRDGQREFLSEVEMLSRLHHKNLVKLIGICAEEHVRCLVYELVPNGSVESHLHGVDKEVARLDWGTRIKIALGAARGLAYLHEDSSPCVIHRDFKSSNILLEYDFMPKVSDFGLATNALNGVDQPVSTQVIGTFGYLAPEYAMSGHLLVKSDVYSYGVVLLELLTGRKPIDFSNPPGQENLVSWAQPLLATNEGLNLLMDPDLKPIYPPETFSKVAAIASMCVQPEATRRPFMGEVVQALKLVCSELDNPNEETLRSSISHSTPGKISSTEFRDFIGVGVHSDDKIALSDVDLASASAQFEGVESETWRRTSSSGPLRKQPLWERLGKFYRGSMRERLWPGIH